MKKLKLKNLVAVALMAMTIATVSPVGASAAWKQDSNGWWNTEANSYSTGWKSIDGNWYFFGSDGYMKTGWVKDGSAWYYLQPSGTMKTGWLYDNNAWYHLTPAGAMETGLVQVDNKTYYLSESGAMKTGNVTINGQNYTFSTSGEKLGTTITEKANTTTQDASKANQEADKTTGSAGGSGGSGGGSSASSDNSSNKSYKDLYGTWSVTEYIPSAKKETSKEKLIINYSVGEQFTISKDNISSDVMTISNPKVEESTITSSALKNAGISGDKVKSIHITDTNNTKQSVDVIIGNNGQTYATVYGLLFKLEKH